MRATASAPTRPARPIWITSVADDTEHAVTHDAMAAGFTDNTGTYRALCRATVIPPAMTEPPGARCPICRAILRNYRRRR
ncbi:hypothetical protein [Kibdelosporangium phytohabitans]|uniref:Uncharacterized protein n=1 Tax=Kibdelosporangium phytohabitans TaxID=860235 RepID=A0A0N9HSY0_9PSEU|nr:hypothetical protein [Kibdelosporangium phytohabitans]ALG10325.1 hypothetical protein AOZ06_28590 [Kibdelosporangium phytohabitans]MBE1461364.1 hypothetical protein [Kibdelosporangium phytohabitans]